MPKQKSCTRKTLTLEQRKNVLSYKDKNPNASVRAIAVHFGVGKTQISEILQKKEEITNCTLDDSSYVIRPYQTKFAAVHQSVYAWFASMRQSNIPINGPILKEKAIQICKKLAETTGNPEFLELKASEGWLRQFKARYNLTNMMIAGEDGAVSNVTTDCWFGERLLEVTEGYGLDQIYNLDETGLFWKELPGKSLNEKGKRCQGGKSSKVRLTVALIAGADGSKEAPIVIGKSHSPRAFKNVASKDAPLGVPYYSNKKSWMNAEVFTDILQKFNRRVAGKGKNVLLLVDNAPCHANMQLSHTKLIFLPPNTTSKTQPLDAGIIKNFKINYRSAYLKHVISQIETVSLDAAVANINILQAIEWIKESWNNVSPTTIRNCFHHCHIMDRTSEQVDDDDPFAADTAAPDSMSCSDDALQLLQQIQPSAEEEDLHPDRALATCAAVVVGEDQLLDQCVAQSIEPLYYASTDNSDDDDVVCVDPTPSASEPCTSTSGGDAVIPLKLALTQMEDIKTYLVSVEADENTLYAATTVQKYLFKKKSDSMKQQKITSFFK